MANRVQDFIDPKGTLGSGAISIMTMGITNSLGTWFGLPLSWTALALSGLFAFLAVIRFVAPMSHKIPYWIANSLIIFSMATGANVVAPPTVSKLTEIAASVQSRLDAMVGSTKEIAKKLPDETQVIKREASRRFFEKWF